MEVKIKKVLPGFLREWSQASGMLSELKAVPSVFVSWGCMVSPLFPSSLSALACIYQPYPCFYIISVSSIQQRLTDFHSNVDEEKESNQLIPASGFAPLRSSVHA